MNPPSPKTAFPPAPDLDYMGLDEIESELGLDVIDVPEFLFKVRKRKELRDPPPVPPIEALPAEEPEAPAAGYDLDGLYELAAEGDIPPDGIVIYEDECDFYIDGTRQVLHNVHPREACVGRYCAIHNPSRHTMRSFPTHFRFDRYLMERICPHGVGHPDPDDLDWQEKHRPETAPGVHGCDGCCFESRDEVEYPRDIPGGVVTPGPIDAEPEGEDPMRPEEGFDVATDLQDLREWVVEIGRCFVEAWREVYGKRR